MNGRSHWRHELSEEPLPADAGSGDPEALEPAPDGANGADGAPAEASAEPIPDDADPAAEPVVATTDGEADAAPSPDAGPAPEADLDTVAAEPGPATQRVHAALPVFLATDAARSADPAVCPYLRLDTGGPLVAPYHSPADDHQCVAYGDPRPQSLRQQELFCLRSEHVDCPRYIRGQSDAGVTPPVAGTRPAIPRATVAALLILILSAGISFGFVLQRGGIDLPVVGSESTPPAVAVVSTPTPAPTAEHAASGAAATPSPAPTAAATAAPAATATPAPTEAPTVAPTVTPAPTEAPTATPAPTPAATPRPTPRPTATPRSSRYALLRPCPDRKGCWIYTVRAGDNLFSIANYFGHSMSVIYAWNPRYAQGAHLRAGDQVRMPPPTR